MRFSKLHGCGNDYVYVDAWRERLPTDESALGELARQVSDRHRGIGGDGLIVVGPDRDGADARMRMFNADGSPSAMCGNGLRCAARLAWDHGHLPGPAVVFASGAGRYPLRVLLDGYGRCRGAEVVMGRPLLAPDAVPVMGADCPAGRPPRLDLLIERRRWELHCVGMGNPHAVVVVDDVDAAPVTTLGPRIETHPAFPERVNVSFIARAGHQQLRQRTWERGSGETLACGSGACASVVAAIAGGLVEGGTVAVDLPGGRLHVHWDGHGEVVLSGEAVHVYDGDWPDAG